uniref:Uncharacterized protein n=2 Tax=Oryza sativa subsp. japonica TaxID=39947 RepID=Q10KA8_ORYSJ|nr:hypothetical protein [Oryza sativa Japonica Group]ABF96364.1 transposon protein, putative, unclassified [Oryza sativa Japonica Group]
MAYGQAGTSKLYTPIIFEAFQAEYERFMAACAEVLDGDNKYLVAIGDENLAFEEEYMVADNTLNILTKEVENKMATSPCINLGDPCAARVDVQEPNVSLTNASLKKKEFRTRNLKRNRSWTDKNGTRRKKQSTTKKTKQQDVENAGLQAQAVEESSSRTNISDVGQYGVINTFTQLLMTGNH